MAIDVEFGMTLDMFNSLLYWHTNSGVAPRPSILLRHLPCWICRPSCSTLTQTGLPYCPNGYVHASFLPWCHPIHNDLKKYLYSFFALKRCSGSFGANRRGLSFILLRSAFECTIRRQVCQPYGESCSVSPSSCWSETWCGLHFRWCCAIFRGGISPLQPAA